MLGLNVERGPLWTLGVVGLALTADHYDTGIVSLALPQIQASLKIPDRQIGIMMASLRGGVAGTLLLGALADKVGRRKVLMWTISGLALCTVLTALAETPLQFFSLQLLARMFGFAEGTIGIVVVTEVMEASNRGWAIGVLSAFGAAGHALSSIIYSFIERVPGGWRGLYCIGFATLSTLVLLRTSLKETERFLKVSRAMQLKESERTESNSKDARRASHCCACVPRILPVVDIKSFSSLFREQPTRLMALSCVVFPFAFAMTPGLNFMSKYLQSERDLSPHAVSILFLLGGGFTVSINLYVGRLSDAFGRKRILSVGFLGMGISFGIFFVAETLTSLAVSWIFGIFFYFICDNIITAIGTELFQTKHRSTASGFRSVLFAIGGGLGLVAESGLFAHTGLHSASLLYLLCSLPLSALAAAVAFPETSRKNLEDIAPDIL